jgi:hypothetical protein
MAGKGNPKGVGRKPGTPNKMTKELKEMILGALDDVGGIEYLKVQALDNPTAFLTLVGKVLPLTVAGDRKAPLTLVVKTGVERSGD